MSVSKVISYILDKESSFARVLVWKCGYAAGHNHVVQCDDFRGTLDINLSDAKLSTVSIIFNMKKLIVDRLDIRLEEGENLFPDDISSYDIAETITNMNGPSMLDVENHPFAFVTVNGIVGTYPNMTLHCNVKMKGTEVFYKIPAKFTASSKSMRMDVCFRFKQTDFGITPYSVMFGAIQVQDELDLRASLNFIKK